MAKKLILAHGIENENYYGELVVPGLGIRLEQLILILYPTLLIPAIAFWYIHLQRQRQRALHPAGCRRLKEASPSNMMDEYEAKYDHKLKTSDWSIKALHIHPIKSCASTEVQQVDITASGMAWDRKFAFVELLPQRSTAQEPNPPPKWTFRTLRQPGWEKLALIKPEVWLPDTTVGISLPKHSTDPNTGGVLLIRYPNVPSGPLGFLDRYLISKGWLPSENTFQVPLTPPPNHRYPREVVNIWKDDPVWLNYSQHIPNDLVEFLSPKHPLGLFRVDDRIEEHRQVLRNAPRKEQLGYQPVVGFQDAYPLHLLNLSSVHDVGSRILKTIPRFSAKRFRSNILVTGPAAYDEDDWKLIRVVSPTGAKSELHCACHTVRCRLPNVDPETSSRHAVEPDKVLKSFRCIDEGDPKNACLGLQLVPANNDVRDMDRGGKVTICVGDKIEVLERGHHLYIRQDQS